MHNPSEAGHPPNPLPLLPRASLCLTALGTATSTRRRFDSPAESSYLRGTAEGKRKVVREVVRLRARGEVIGTVAAPDQQAVLRETLKAFELKAEEANRLLVRPSRAKLAIARVRCRPG